MSAIANQCRFGEFYRRLGEDYRYAFETCEEALEFSSGKSRNRRAFGPSSSSGIYR